MGTANVAVPAAFCTDNAQFAFHFYKKANRGYDDTDAMFAIDNVTMTYGTTDPCADGHTLTTAVAEVPRHLPRPAVKGPLGVLRLQQAVQRRRRQERDHPGGPDHRRAGPRLGRARVDLDRLRRRRGLLRLRPGCRPCEGPARQHHQRGHHPAGCSTEGVRTYTATVTLEGKNYTDTRTETLPSLGHAWGEPVDLDRLRRPEASFACARDAGHVKVLPASITSEGHHPARLLHRGRPDLYRHRDPGRQELYRHPHPRPCPPWVTRPSWWVLSPPPARKTATPATRSAPCAEEVVKKGEVIPALGHKTQLVGAKAATCTEDGYTGDEVCTVCGETVKKGEVIPAPGHKTQLVGAKAATCTEDGYTGDEVCTVCQEVVKKGEVIPATGHDYKDGKCANCGETDPNYKPAEPRESRRQDRR